jgi:predicted house-cleaning noncanonical NTP pyrophosphatase (MazG superfamily)
MIKYNFEKLIRHKLPARMKSEGVVVYSKKLNSLEYLEKLKLKLVEEANEVVESIDSPSIIKELADVLEVIHALAREIGVDINDIEAERLLKREINGHFEPDNYVHFIEVPKDNKVVIEYLANKNKPYSAS